MTNRAEKAEQEKYELKKKNQAYFSKIHVINLSYV